MLNFSNKKLATRTSFFSRSALRQNSEFFPLLRIIGNDKETHSIAAKINNTIRYKIMFLRRLGFRIS